MKEATARIKINKLLESAGGRFFSEGKLLANIQLKPSVTIKVADLDALGNNFEKTVKGFVDFLLLDSRGFPLIVLEAKLEDKNPLVSKELLLFMVRICVHVISKSDRIAGVERFDSEERRSLSISACTALRGPCRLAPGSCRSPAFANAL